MNPWLNYSPPLHRAREIGAHHRIFDVLDERLLTYGIILMVNGYLVNGDLI